METAAAALRAEISALYDERKVIAEAARRTQAQSAAASAEFAAREGRAVDGAAQRVAALTTHIAAQGAAAGRANDAAAAAAAHMKVELQVLRDEEEVRAKRIAGLEGGIKKIQGRIAAQAGAYEDVLRNIAGVKGEFASGAVS
jgi:hypothetical protein